jgi:flagellar M-ring protein FliF
MFEMFGGIVTRFREIWAAMSLNQKVISGGVIAALIVAAAWILSLGTVTKYSVLFAQIEPKDAGEITSFLTQKKIPYRVTQNGTAIEVPADRADRLKMDLSVQGLPSSGIVGYEILDTTNFGMPDFLLKINYRRAMEGELSRTLRTLDAVEDAKVKIAIPEPTLFTEARKPTTASVTIKVKQGRTISGRSVEAITNLIASSIEGLDPQNVTVVDTRGNLLTKPSRDSLAMLSSTQMELKIQVDNYLADKVKSLLDGAFGSGKALVTVNTELDFDRLERKTTTYDPTKSTPVSEERVSVTNPTAEGGEEENTVTNYEVGSVVENLVKSPGTITKLTMSVMIDGRDSTVVDARGRSQTVKVPWTPAQLASLRTISENAVGYNPDRGDRLVVEYMEFGVREEEIVGRRALEVRAALVESVQAVVTGVVILAALAVFFFIVRIISKSLDPARIRIPLEADFELKKAELVQEEEKEADTEKTLIIRKIVSRAIRDPEAIARGLKTFYRE